MREFRVDVEIWLWADDEFDANDRAEMLMSDCGSHINAHTIVEMAEVGA